nr:hypothetical protein [Thermasporomyces composti]
MASQVIEDRRIGARRLQVEQNDVRIAGTRQLQDLVGVVRDADEVQPRLFRHQVDERFEQLRLVTDDGDSALSNLIPPESASISVEQRTEPLLEESSYASAKFLWVNRADFSVQPMSAK